MTTPPSRLDAAMLSRLAPWLELLVPKAQAPSAGVGQVPSVSSTPRVANDLLQPARADLQAQAAAAGHERMAPAASAPVRAAAGAELSAAARVIMGLLAQRQGGDAAAAESSLVRGAAPVWADAGQPPASGPLAAALAQQVSQSGLFYESHLAQFAAGARSLAQMQAQPQAGLGGGFAAPDAAGDGQPQGAAARLLPLVAPPPPAHAVPPATMAAVVDRPDLHAAGAAAAQELSQKGDASDAGLRHAPAGHAAARDGGLPDAAAREVAAREAGMRDAGMRDAGMREAVMREPAATAGGAPVHPGAQALVNQQLDLLATSVFRWTGEAWPGVPMRWDVKEEGADSRGDSHAAYDEAAVSSRWMTTVSLSLPTLGRVDLRLQLDGAELRALAAATCDQTADQLRAHGAALSLRLADAGLDLKGLDVDTEIGELDAP